MHSMFKYVAKKLLNAIIVFLIATICIFAMVKAAGMNPVLATMGGGNLSAEALSDRMARYGLDKPILLQYVYWLKNILVGNFGESVKFKVAVSTLIADSAPVTIWLALSSFISSQIIALLLGIWAAVKRNTIVDHIITVITLVLFSVPVFFFGMLVILFLTNYMPEISYSGSITTFSGYIERLLPPVLIMASHEIALVTKVTRSSMIEQLNSDYVLTLKAKGLSRPKIIFKHALKNGIIPVITISGIQFGALIVGCVLVENIFSISGLGRLMVQSVSVGDISVIQGISILVILVFLVVNLLVDTLYALIDPRIREQNGGWKN